MPTFTIYGSVVNRDIAERAFAYAMQKYFTTKVSNQIFRDAVHFGKIIDSEKMLNDNGIQIHR